jgi:hypothetical protein
MTKSDFSFPKSIQMTHQKLSYFVLEVKVVLSKHRKVIFYVNNLPSEQELSLHGRCNLGLVLVAQKKVFKIV